MYTEVTMFSGNQIISAQFSFINAGRHRDKKSNKLWPEW